MARKTSVRSIRTIHRQIALGNKQTKVDGYVKPNIRKSFRDKVIAEATKKLR